MNAEEVEAFERNPDLAAMVDLRIADDGVKVPGKVVPPLANEFIALVKNSAIVSLISVHELTYKTVELVASTRAIFEAWITTAIFYFILCFGLSLLFRRLEGVQRN